MKMNSRGIGVATMIAMFASVAQANESTPRLHPVEKVCVEYEHSGQMQSGSSTRCHRDYGYEIYEIQNLSMGLAGITQTQRQHNITIGDTIYAIDPETNTGTKTRNPMYDGIVRSVGESSVEELSEHLLSVMGMTPTGRSKSIAGETCIIHDSSMLGSACLTDGGVLLEQEVLGNTMRATSVTYDEGDDANYTLYRTAQITKGPDLSEGLGGAGLGDLVEQHVPDLSEGLGGIGLGDLIGGR